MGRALRRCIRVEAPHFVAGLEVAHNQIVRAAPIVKWALHKHLVDTGPHSPASPTTVPGIIGRLQAAVVAHLFQHQPTGDTVNLPAVARESGALCEGHGSPRPVAGCDAEACKSFRRGCQTSRIGTRRARRSTQSNVWPLALRCPKSEPEISARPASLSLLGIEQFGSSPALEAGGRRFKSGCPDHLRGRAAVARLAHNQKVAGSNPAPATSCSAEPSQVAKNRAAGGCGFAARIAVGSALLSNMAEVGTASPRALTGTVAACGEEMPGFSVRPAMPIEVTA